MFFSARGPHMIEDTTPRTPLPGEVAPVRPTPSDAAPPEASGVPSDAGAAPPARTLTSRTRTWWSIAGAVILVLLGAFTGASLYHAGYLPGSAKPADAAILRQEMKERVARPWTASLAEIYSNNLRATVILWLGIGTAGLLTSVQMFWLGASVGMTVARSLHAGLSGDLVFWFLFPHGVPEVLGFLLAGSVGLHGAFLFQRYLGGGPLVVSTDVRALLPRIGLSFGLVLIAGPVEVFLTPAIAARYL